MNLEAKKSLMTLLFFLYISLCLVYIISFEVLSLIFFLPHMFLFDINPYSSIAILILMFILGVN